MDPKLTEFSQLFGRFKAALTRNDYDTCTNLLSQLKVPAPETLIGQYPSRVHVMVRYLRFELVPILLFFVLLLHGISICVDSWFLLFYFSVVPRGKCYRTFYS